MDDEKIHWTPLELIQNELAALTQFVVELKQGNRVITVKDVAAIKKDVADLKVAQAKTNTTLDLILVELQKVNAPDEVVTGIGVIEKPTKP